MHATPYFGFLTWFLLFFLSLPLDPFSWDFIYLVFCSSFFFILMESGAFYPVFSGHSTMLPHTPEFTSLRYTTSCHTPQDSAPPSVFKGSRALLHLTLWGFLLWFGLIYAFIGCNGSSLQHAGSVAVMPCSMWDLTSPTKDQTCIPCIGRQVLNN